LLEIVTYGRSGFCGGRWDGRDKLPGNLLNPAEAKNFNNTPLPAGLNEPNRRSFQSTSKHHQI
jgi:hypothetical protein